MTATTGPTVSDPAPVRAAGTLCWRLGPGPDLQIQVVHRPRYDDWSLPKGHVEPKEFEQVCAARETAEETGALVELGVALPTVRYVLPDGRPKQVRFWAARSVGAILPSADEEVDRTSWLDLDTAGRRLSYPDEQAVLDAAAGLAATGRLCTVPLVVVRHALAREKDSWTRLDVDRPLVGSGRRRARELAELLGCWQPRLLLSSPSLRCRQTLEPYARSSGRRVVTKKGLGLDGFRQRPEKAARHVHRLLDAREPAVLCGHREVLPAVFAALAEGCEGPARDRLPGPDDGLAPGEVLVAHLSATGARPELVAVERISGG